MWDSLQSVGEAGYKQWENNQQIVLEKFGWSGEEETARFARQIPPSVETKHVI